eukprot:TRINITY_DN60549_c0_g1_i1.p1 TRINITY_DN60549_c0_g1~~TRINITY_DN60549_c0_g1_i1.p1  ORF type:complete len:692 (+),score=105.75 TRINITY_DN60549_c0_g1_i1:42-2117(+)
MAVQQQLQALSREVYQIREVIKDVPQLQLQLELLKADVAAIQDGTHTGRKSFFGFGGSQGSSGQVDLLASLKQENVELNKQLSQLRTDFKRAFAQRSGQQEARDDQSWTDYFSMGGSGVAERRSMPSQRPRDVQVEALRVTTYEHEEDSDSGGEDMHGEMLLQIHLPESKENLLGLEVSQFRQSVWDAALVVMLHTCSSSSKIIGRFNEVWAWLLLCMNLTLQIFMMLALNSIVDPNPFLKMKSAILNERLREGQSYSAFSRENMLTMTQQLCSFQDLSVNQISDTSESLSQYVNDDQRNGIISGKYICLLAVVLWVTSMGIELKQILHDSALLLLSLPRTRRLSYDVRGDRYVITGVPILRKMNALLLVVLPRLLISICLLWLGIVFLVGTVRVDDLILKVVALEFMQRIHELLFRALVPSRMASMLSAMGLQIYAARHQTVPGNTQLGGAGLVPPETKRGMSNGMQYLYAFIRVAYVAGILVGTWFLYLKPLAASTLDVWSEACGHDTNFTYIYDPVTDTPIFAHPSPEGPAQELRCFRAAQKDIVKMRAGFRSDYLPHNITLLALIDGSHPACLKTDTWGRSDIACPESTLHHIEAVMSPRHEIAGDDRGCRDQDVFFFVLKGVCLSSKFVDDGDYLGFFKDVSRCEDLRNQCHSTAAHAISLPWFWKLQQICPETCGKCKAPSLIQR